MHERHAFSFLSEGWRVGLNLTGADTVILVDLWWNPAVEDQAIGRAHEWDRNKMLEVYRMITRGTIEEKSKNYKLPKDTWSQRF